MNDLEVVKPEEIEPKLVKIWDELQGKNKMRACLFNLVIYAKQDKRTKYLQTLSKKIVQRFPSRIIFVSEDTKPGQDYLQTKVSVLTADQGQNEIFCDLIHIDVCGEHRKRVPFVILPHLLPDLPIYLLWGDDPAKEDPLSFNLEKVATRTIFDSEAAENLTSFAKAIFKHHKITLCDIADLNWARIESWRHLFASTFFSVEKLNELCTATQIQIDYNCLESESFCHTPTQAIYFQAWIAKQLNWQFQKVEKENNALKFNYTHANGNVSILLNPEEMQDLKPGRLIRITIQKPDNHSLVFSRKKTHSHHIIIEECTEDVCQLSSQHVFDREESGQSLVNEICHKGTSQHYINMLQLLAEIEEGVLY